MNTQWPPKSATELRNRIIELEAALAAEKVERLGWMDECAALEAALAERDRTLDRWKFIGTHEYTLRRPKHLGGGPGVVGRGGWELDGLDAEFDRSRVR